MRSPAPIPRLVLLVGLLLLAAGARLLPHPPNFVPTGAMALFGAAVLPQRWLAFALPLLAFYLSDLVLNNVVYAAYFDGFYLGIDPWVYGGVALMVLLGFGVLRHARFSWLRVLGAAAGATVVFFLVSNFGVWLGSPVYPQSLGGLGLAYAAGLPFLVNSLLANLVFSGLLFGVAGWLGVRERQAVRVNP